MCVCVCVCVCVLCPPNWSWVNKEVALFQKFPIPSRHSVKKRAQHYRSIILWGIFTEEKLVFKIHVDEWQKPSQFCGVIIFSSVQFSRSVVSDSLRPHEPQHARPPCYHQLPESTQTHVHRVSDAIQPSHSLSSPSPPALNLSQHQGLFQGVSSSHQVAKLLEFQLQHQTFQWAVFKKKDRTWLLPP